MYLGVDIGGTKTLVACLNEHGVIKERVKFPTPQVYGVFLRELAKVVANFSTGKFVAAGVAAPGKIDRTRGIAMAFGNLPWKDVPLKADIERMVRCPVVVENDANLAGLSEAMLVKDRYNKVLYVTISTGIGTGIIVDQRIDPAFADSEGGHMILEHHSTMQRWQDFASGKAIVKRFGKRAHDITDEKTWHTIAHDMALGLIELVAVVQPEVIILGGGVGRYFDHYRSYLELELGKYENPLVPIPPLQAAARPDDAVVYGCYDLAESVYGSARS